MSKEEHIEELTNINSNFFNDIDTNLSKLSKKINKLTPKYYKVHSELQQCKNFNSHLLIIELELNAATDLQFRKKETIVLNLVPADITDYVLEENICSTLPLAGVNVVPNDLRACHQMKSSDRVMVKIKFGQQKNYIMNKCKSVGNKYQERTNLKFLEDSLLVRVCLTKITSIALNPVPADITEDVLEENICDALSLTGVNVVPNDLCACHQLKSSDRVRVKIKFGQQKNYIMNKCKSVGNKYQELTNLKFSGRLFVSESMPHKNHRLAYKC